MNAKTGVDTFRNGLSSLLRPEDSVLVLIDHQPYQLANVNSHEPQMVINNTAGLANCDTWTSTQAGEYGTIVRLAASWTVGATAISPWQAASS